MQMMPLSTRTMTYEFGKHKNNANEVAKHKNNTNEATQLENDGI